jgi:hypothetical protein
MGSLIKHSFTNGSVLLILIVVDYWQSEEQAWELNLLPPVIYLKVSSNFSFGYGNR